MLSKMRIYQDARNYKKYVKLMIRNGVSPTEALATEISCIYACTLLYAAEKRAIRDKLTELLKKEHII